MVLIGLTGTMGAGKGTVVEYLVEQKGFLHFSARAFLVKEIERRGLPVNRDSMIMVSNDLRKAHSPSYIGEQLLKEAQQVEKPSIIESILTVGEAKFLKSEGAILLAIDADQRMRYERITARQSETDQVTFEHFVEQENKKMHSTDPTKHNVAGVMEMADAVIMNNGTLEELHEQIDRVLQHFGL